MDATLDEEDDLARRQREAGSASKLVPMLSRSKPQQHEKRREAMPGTTYTLESRIGTRTFADRCTPPEKVTRSASTRTVATPIATTGRC